MKLLKLSKYTIAAALCGSLLTTYSTSNAAALSWTQSSPAANTTAKANVSIWDSMAKNFNIKNYADNPRVQQQIARLVKNQKSLYLSLQKAGPYISYVYQQTQKHGLPAELALLPSVESGFNPTAKSPVGAKGLWQLMPRTAVELGVKTTGAYDGRVDIIASTQAALSYLGRLGQTFNSDWYLALAAYNAGPGRVRGAIKKQNPWYKRSNFWALKLPQETQNYVPQLLAIAAIVKNPAKYGVTLPEVNSRLATITVAGNVDFKKITNTTSVSMETMKQLNPGHRNLTTSSGTPSSTLLVPANAVAEIKPVVAVIATTLVTHVDNTSKLDANKDTTPDTDTQDETLDSTPSVQSHGNTHLVKAILQEGKWLIFALANIPSSDSIAA